jgi:Na+/citrate or Na+/malate symporter
MSEFLSDLSLYLAAKLGGATVYALPGIAAALLFRRSRGVSTLSGAIGALILPISGIYHAILPGGAADHAVLLAMSAALGALYGLAVFEIFGRRRPKAS